MARKWFQLVGEDGNALAPVDAAVVEFEDVAGLRDAVFAKVSRALPATVIAANLTVFANRAAFDTNQALPRLFSSVKEYGNDEDNVIIVQVPPKAASGMSMIQRWENDVSAYVASSVSFVTSLIASDTSQRSKIQATKKNA